MERKRKIRTEKSIVKGKKKDEEMVENKVEEGCWSPCVYILYIFWSLDKDLEILEMEKDSDNGIIGMCQFRIKTEPKRHQNLLSIF